jgi:PAS domain S-box-containing protein
MHEDLFAQYIQQIRSNLSILHEYGIQQTAQQPIVGIVDEIETTLDNLQLLQEELQTHQTQLEANNEYLVHYIEQCQHVQAEYKHYYDLFMFAPDGYLVIDAQEIILDANEAVSTLLGTTRHFLLGKPLSAFVAEASLGWQTELQRSIQTRSNWVREWTVQLQPCNAKPFKSAMTVVAVRDGSGAVVTLRVGIKDISNPPISPSPHLPSPNLPW